MIESRFRLFPRNLIGCRLDLLTNRLDCHWVHRLSPRFLPFLSSLVIEGLPLTSESTKWGGLRSTPSSFNNFAKLARHICENSMLNGEVIRLDGAIRMAPR